MKIDERKINISSLAFYIAYFLLIFQSMTRWVYHLEKFQSICPFLILSILFFSIILEYKKIPTKNAIIIFLVCIVSFFSFLKCRDIAIIYIIIFTIAFKEKDYRKLIKFDLISKSILLLLIFFLYSQGLTEKVIYYYNVRGVRYALGFGHPNTLGIYLLNICADIAYLNYDKKKIIPYIFMIAIALFANYVPRSRGTFVGVLLLIALSYMIPIIKENGIFKFIMKHFCTILMVTSFLVGFIFLNSEATILTDLNKLFSNRIELIADFLDTYDITVFGNRFTDYNTSELGAVYTLDNAYITILLKFGILVAISFLWMMSLKMKQSVERKQYVLIMCLLTYMFFGLMENGFYVLAYNPFLISFAQLINNKKKIEGESNENFKFNQEQYYRFIS